MMPSTLRTPTIIVRVVKKPVDPTWITRMKESFC